MPKVVIKYFYNEIKYLVSIIDETEIFEKLVKAARKQDFLELQARELQFQEEYPCLYASITEFFEDYKSEGCPEIFDEMEGNKRFKYDPEEIDPKGLCVLIMLSNGEISDDDIFLDPEVFCEAMQDAGEAEIADYMDEYSIQSLEDLGVAFAEAAEEYEEDDDDDDEY